MLATMPIASTRIGGFLPKVSVTCRMSLAGAFVSEFSERMKVGQQNKLHYPSTSSVSVRH